MTQYEVNSAERHHIHEAFFDPLNLNIMPSSKLCVQDKVLLISFLRPNLTIAEARDKLEYFDEKLSINQVTHIKRIRAVNRLEALRDKDLHKM